MKMSLKKLSDSYIEILIELWKNERALWDMTFLKYSNADVDERKAPLSRISHEMDDLNTLSHQLICNYWQTSVLAFDIRLVFTFFYSASA